MGINTLNNKAIFLDRDGVLNKSIVKFGKPYPPKSKEELSIPSGVKKGVSILKENGFRLIMITNQPDVSRGKISLKKVEEINQFLSKELKLDDVFCCPHDDKDMCKCRKPKPGMIIEAVGKWKIDVSKSFLIGDRWKDIEAGKQTNLKTILLDYNYNEKRTKPDYSCSEFMQAVKIIIET